MKQLMPAILLVLAACASVVEVEPVEEIEVVEVDPCPFGAGEYELQRTVVDNTCGDYIGPITPLSRVQQSLTDGALEGCRGTVTVLAEGCGFSVAAECDGEAFEGEFAWDSEAEYSGVVTREYPELNCLLEIEVDAILFEAK